MDKAERQPAVALPEHTMIVVQDLTKLSDSVDEVLTPLPIMVNMNLDVSNTVKNHFGQRFN